MKILVACRKFDGVIGGVERMSTTLMNELVNRGHEVVLFTWDFAEDAKSFYPMHESIQWIKLSMGDPKVKAGWKLRFQRALRVRKILRSIAPDAVIGFQEGVYTTLQLYGLGLGIPMVCAVRNSPFRDSSIPSSPHPMIVNLALIFASAVTVQFERYGRAFPHIFRNKIYTIPNHVFQTEKITNPGQKTEKKIVLTTGRLSPEKNQAALVDAFAMIADRLPDWELVIVGRGSEENNLRTKISTLSSSVAKRIHLVGPSNDIAPWLEKAQVFCFPSWWEGFPNSLAEAMACGLPCVGFEECDGVRDLIDDGKTGLLASGLKDPKALSEKLLLLMEDGYLREKMGRLAQEEMKKYEPSKVFDQWDSMLIEASNK